MAHFAQLDENNDVVDVINLDTMEMVSRDTNAEVESMGLIKLQSMFGSDTKWVQTHYGSSIRSKFASIGDKYDESKDCFISPKPYPSWTFSDTTLNWEAPETKPDDIVDENGEILNSYTWNESENKWELLVTLS